jgi:hypothetical protein
MIPRTFGLQIQGTTCLGDSTIQIGVPVPVVPLADPGAQLRTQIAAAQKAAQEERYAARVGRRIRFLEPPHITEYWIKNEIRIFGRASWHPRLGMTGTVIDLPKPGTIGAGPKIRWDDGHETWLGSVSQYEFLN